MLTIYEINEAYKNVLGLIEDGLDPADLEIALKNIEEELEVKADNYAIVINRIKTDVEMLKKEEQRLYNKRKSLENSIDYMKKNLEDSMWLQDKKKFKTSKFSFGIQKNPPSLKVLDSASVPEDYKEIIEEIKIDKKKILQDIKNGVEITGVEVVQSESLRIR